jgi:hypothetical protein
VTRDGSPPSGRGNALLDPGEGQPHVPQAQVRVERRLHFLAVQEPPGAQPRVDFDANDWVPQKRRPLHNPRLVKVGQAVEGDVGRPDHRQVQRPRKINRHGLYLSTPLYPAGQFAQHGWHAGESPSHGD